MTYPVLRRAASLLSDSLFLADLIHSKILTFQNDMGKIASKPDKSLKA